MSRAAITGATCALFAAVAPSLLRAESTNAVDIAALVVAADATGTSYCDGWTLSGLESYDANCLKFNTLTPAADALVSTNYPRAIVGLAVSLRCSSVSPTRFLAVIDSETDVEIARFAAPSAKDKLEPQVLRFGEATGLRHFTLKLVGSGNTGVWGVGGLSVIMADPVETPTGLRVLHTGATRVELAWTNSYSTVSNEMTITRFVASDAGETTLFECGFDNFSAAGNPALCIDRLPPELSGELIYSPANTNSICQISSGDKRGVLLHEGFADYAGIVLRLCIMRYRSDYAKTKIRWTDGSTTNDFAVIDLMDVFTVVDVALEGIPGGARIMIGDDTAQGSRRVWLDSMAFVRAGSIREEVVGVKAFPAPSGPFEAGTMDVGFPRLASETSHRVYLRAYNQEGDVSSGSVQVDFTTAKPIPSVFRLF